MKSILLIGLGRFGQHICKKLNELGLEVLAVDRNEDRVDKVLPYATSALIGDSTDRAFLETLGIPSFDKCIVAIGDDFQSSLETADLLKELGAKRVVSRAASGIQAKFLSRNGADTVVYPEQQLADWIAIRCSSDHIFDYFELDHNHAIVEIAVPDNWDGKTVADLDVRRRYGINIMAVKQDDVLDIKIEPDQVLKKGERILVLCDISDIQTILKL